MSLFRFPWHRTLDSFLETFSSVLVVSVVALVLGYKIVMFRLLILDFPEMKVGVSEGTLRLGETSRSVDRKNVQVRGADG